jgi:hypothetical protein
MHANVYTRERKSADTINMVKGQAMLFPKLLLKVLEVEFLKIPKIVDA